MKDYEYDNSGNILVQDLPRVFKRIGILKPEIHMKTLIKAGGASENDDVIDFITYG